MPAIQSDFLDWDDYGYVLNNPDLKKSGLDFIRYMFTSIGGGNWHPMVWLSFRCDYELWELKPTGYHLTNIVLHGLNTFLVVLLVARLFTNALGGNGMGIIFTAALGGAVFGLHPLHVESVVWISERKDMLYAFFWLLSIHMYVKYANSESRKIHFYWLCLIFFLLSIMSKPMAVTLPVVLLILDYFPLKRIYGKIAVFKVTIYEKIPFYVLAFAISIITLLAQAEAMMPLKRLTLAERFFVAVRNTGFYLFKTVLPINLIPFYPIPAKIPFFSFEYLGAFFFFVVATVVCMTLRRRMPLPAAAWAYYLITLLPTLGIVQVGSQLAADRYMYLPMLGPIFLTCSAAVWLWKKRERSHVLLMGGAVLMAIVLSLITIKQTRIWGDSLTFWQYVAKKNPEDPFSRNFLGRNYSRQGKHEKALEYFNKAIALDILQAEFYFDRGNTLSDLDQYGKAVKDFTRAIKLGIEGSDVYLNRGNAYSALRDYEKALEDYNTAIGIDPENAEAYFNRAFVYSQLGSVRKSNEDYLKAISIDPDLLGAYNNLGINYIKAGEYHKAIEYFDKAVTLDETYANAYFNRARAHEGLGNLELADRDYKMAFSLGYGQGEGQAK